jgi:pyrrolidone-carboxylate peptidase
MSPVADGNSSLVVTGFEPFNGRRRNRSWDAVKGLSLGQGVQIHQLPVDFARLREAVPRLMSSGPRGLLLVGESATKNVRVEQVGLNIIHSDRPDNAGVRPQMETLVSDGPLALLATWDARSVARKLSQNGVPAVASFHAGTFACNAAFYLALYGCASPTRVGFLHVPCRAWPFGMRTSILRRAIGLCLEVLTDNAPAEASQARPDAALRRVNNGVMNEE